MRRRVNALNKENISKIVTELDAFPKVPETYVKTTASGGGLSIVIFIIMVVLIYFELQYYTATELKFKYEVDKDMNSKLQINIDMTVAMKCAYIGADVLDITGQSSANIHGKLQEEPVWFELSPKQKEYQTMIAHVNEYVRSEYHALQDMLWKTGYKGMSSEMPKREDEPVGAYDGCRIHGKIQVNKLAGNFHITAGKSIPHFAGHAHLSAMVDRSDYNFSHRIDEFSFGVPTPGVVNPLDGDEMITKDNYHMFQYFIQVVPTKVHTSHTNLETYQYAVTERNRTINHSSGSHGVAGVFVKYDLSALKFTVTEEHKPYWQFMVRLCGIIGGIFVTSGLIHSIMGCFVDVICCRFQLGSYKPSDSKSSNASVPVHSLNNINTSIETPPVTLVQTAVETPIGQLQNQNNIETIAPPSPT
ncbi:unnamed protein product [Owenia fusiformis]|uniref:Uncharacterized protein n=1 Tax=Owenia fusiformis TaxID=6347 RepID=A0A8J1XUX4_OWEFU|nr:unnamed protein product [Owenia fusiformis]